MGKSIVEKFEIWIDSRNQILSLHQEICYEKKIFENEAMMEMEIRRLLEEGYKIK